MSGRDWRQLNTDEIVKHLCLPGLPFSKRRQFYLILCQPSVALKECYRWLYIIYSEGVLRWLYALLGRSGVLPIKWIIIHHLLGRSATDQMIESTPQNQQCTVLWESKVTSYKIYYLASWRSVQRKLNWKSHMVNYLKDVNNMDI